MATLQELRDAVDRLLGLQATGQLLQLNSGTCERAYEAYVFSLVCQAVRDAGGTATLTGVNSGSIPATVVMRGSPGRLASTDQDFCYAACRLGNKTFEIHVDVTFEGNSGATHEVDVSVVDARHAQDARITGRLPRTNKYLIAAFECKFYTSQAPGVSLARTFVGLARDCTSNRVKAFVANRSAAPLSQYLSTSWAPKPFTDLTPLTPNTERRFVAFMEQALRQWAFAR